jgi:N-methylhydantoinase A
VDVRYRGQSYELNVPWNDGDPAPFFHAEHRKVYGYADAERAVEFVTIRVRARLAAPPLQLRSRSSRQRAGSPGRRRIYVDGWRDVPVYRRGQVPGKAAPGPALVTDYGSTTLVRAGWRLHVDRAGNLLLQRR